MAITITKIKGPAVEQGNAIKYTFSILLDTSFATGGESLNLTSYFSYVFGGKVLSNDTAADATWRYDIITEGYDVAHTATNCKLVAHHGSGSDAVDNPADAEDLSTVGELIVEIVGKAKIVSSWA